MDHSSVLHQHQPSYPSIDHSSSSDISSASRQHDLMAYLESLKEFLATAPSRWPTSPSDAIPPSQQHPALNRFLLPSNEYVTCVNWNHRYYITGTDIVRALVLRFEAFGRPVKNMKKFEEGIFSDLRNLKPGQDACLEDPKVFSVPHDRLFIDALERDLKREKIGLGSTTSVVAEPALSFSYEPKRPLFEQLNAATLTAPTAESRSTTVLLSSQATKSSLRGRAGSISLPDLKIGTTMLSRSSLESPRGSTWEEGSDMSTNPPASNSHSPLSAANSPTTSGPSRGNSFFNMFAFLEGTPTYKQRRKKAKNRRGGCSIINDDDHRMRHSLEMHLARRSFDVAPRGYEYEGCNGVGFGRHSLDSFQHTNFLSGSAHYGFSHPGPQRIRVPNLPETTGTAPPPRPSLPSGITTTHAPTPGHVCPLYTCRQIFSTPEQLQHHISRHTERSGGGPNGMDVDPEGQREQLFVHTLTANTTTAHPIPIPAVSRNLSGSPEIPTFTHVLTTPDGSPRYDYDYEDDSGYAAPDWSHHHHQPQQYHHHVSAKIQSQQHATQNAVYERPPPPIPAQGMPHIAPQPMHPSSQQYQASSYAFETTSVESVSSASSSCYPPPSPTYPVSAPANQLTFSIPEVPPIMSDNNYVQNRRPRSVTPSDSQPVHRPTHGRRPSTATAVPTASFGGGGGGPTTPFGVGRSNSLTTFTLSSQQQQQQQQQPAQQQVPSSWRIPPRGYHPYAAPDHSTRPSTSYSTSSAQSSQGSSSPFAVHMSAVSGNEYTTPSSEGQPGEYLQEPSGIKYEQQDYHITREPEYVAKEACHQVEYASTSEISPSGYEMAAIDQLHGEYAVDENAGGEYMSSSDPGTTTQQGYISQEPSPEAQFVQLSNNLTYPEDSYNNAVNVGSQDYPIQTEDGPLGYPYASDMSAEVAVPYDSGHGHTYPMQMGHHHHHHHDVQMLPYYQQQVA
ncbi:hypothetical protein Clacol_003500 [Clathrus columnatus]|uniref:C2H2-type domain-containing protein n=1 Tax=Clathrus columnatus TaxID=1419009 RepID=A0AAV5A7T7_9AGAM|nr:hypothetical protein Clacol_003500 [Clathrus columnatus]